MAYDALSLSLLAEEFKTLLVGGKITKIYQPERDEVVLFVFNKQTHKLLISANAGVNRIHVTQMPTDNPKTAPTFCMLLRKHITNATITGVSQMPFERVLDFALNVSDDLGYKKDMHLVFELTGKTSNIILTDGNYVILDSIKHLPQDLNSTRLVMAGAKYHFFEPQPKIAPTDTARLRAYLENCVTPLRTALTENVLGVSQTTVNEILYKIDENDHTLVNHSLVVDRICQYLANLRHPKPNVVLKDGTPIEVCPFEYQTKKGQRLYFETLNQAHDNYYYLLDRAQRFSDKAKSVTAVVKNAISRTEKKLAAQRQSVLEAQNRETLKNQGDLILSNLWQIKHNSDKLVCTDYTTGEMVTIPLDKSLTPQQNAQAYYKKYRKQKSSAEHNGKLVEENSKLLNYLQTIKQSLRYCTEPDDLQQIREELVGLGLIKEKTTAKGKKAQPAITPLKYDIDGYTVYVGKNNAQNNHVTFKLAKSDDLWLHTQKIHSSHVVIANHLNKPIPDNVIVQAAEICAFYSQANGDKIPVDYTTKNFVKKPNKAPLGFVVYTDYQTILVNPDRHLQNLR